MKSRFIRIFIFCIIGLLIGAGIGLYQANNDATVSVTQKTTRTATAGAQGIGGDYTLTDHNGNTVTQDSFSDKHTLMFFGFTYCPAVCPTELQKMTAVLEALGDKANAITPIFVTVDPERDDVATMKAYVEQFHPRLVGLTGTPEQIKDMTAKYRIYASKVENEMMEGYMMDHSAYMYLMSPENTMVEIYAAQDTVAEIVENLETKL